MRGALVILFFLSSTASALTPEWGLGMALQARVQNEVNPGLHEAKPMNQFFLRARHLQWGGLLEVGQEGESSSSGNFSIETKTLSTTLWGRFEPWNEGRWSPFLAAGAGIHFDKMETRLGGLKDSRSGQRKMFGLGTGLSRNFFRNFMFELEARVLSIELNRNLAYSGILRLGYVF